MCFASLLLCSISSRGHRGLRGLQETCNALTTWEARVPASPARHLQNDPGNISYCSFFPLSLSLDAPAQRERKKRTIGNESRSVIKSFQPPAISTCIPWLASSFVTSSKALSPHSLRLYYVTSSKALSPHSLRLYYGSIKVSSSSSPSSPCCPSTRPQTPLARWQLWRNTAETRCKHAP
jgi:hypothetical protein